MDRLGLLRLLPRAQRFSRPSPPRSRPASRYPADDEQTCCRVVASGRPAENASPSSTKEERHATLSKGVLKSTFGTDTDTEGGLICR